MNVIRKIDFSAIEKSNKESITKPKVSNDTALPSNKTQLEKDNTKINQVEKGSIPQESITFAPTEEKKDTTITNVENKEPEIIEEKKVTETKEAPKKNSLTSFGEKFVNQPILDHYLSFRNNPMYKPIIAQIDLAIKKGASIKDIEKIAVNSTHKLYSSLPADKTLSMAYKSILASTIHNKYSDPNFFNGERDKIFHYFVSGSMTLDAHDTFLPKKLAGFGVLAIGWAKEVVSIPGNGYGADDMQANKAGINSALSNLEKFEKNKSL